jgi:hypothetical protein
MRTVAVLRWEEQLAESKKASANLEIARALDVNKNNGNHH